VLVCNVSVLLVLHIYISSLLHATNIAARLWCLKQGAQTTRTYIPPSSGNDSSTWLSLVTAPRRKRGPLCSSVFHSGQWCSTARHRECVTTNLETDD